jgi:hypothetical protein
MMTEKKLTYGEVALRWNCSIVTVRRAVSDGRLAPVLRINRQVIRIPISSVLAFEANDSQRVSNAIK